jgi:hypothetical protein
MHGETVKIGKIYDSLETTQKGKLYIHGFLFKYVETEVIQNCTANSELTVMSLILYTAELGYSIMKGTFVPL